jgi:hypothetical protein
MASLSTSTRWTLALLTSCLALTAVLWANHGWIALGVQPINPERTPWSDTLIHLATAVNCADDLGEWHGRVCFVPSIDAVPRAQTYEPWLTLHRLGVDDIDDVLAIALLTVVAFCVAFALTLRPASAGQATLALLVFCTTGVQLAIERGNFDLLISAMICLSGGLLARPRVPSALGGIAVLSVATMLKLYTGLAALMAWFIARVPWRISIPAAIAALVLAVMVVGPRELLILGQGAPEGATRFSTGSRWLFLQAGPAWGVAAIITALVAMAATRQWLANGIAPDFTRWPRRVAVFQIAFLTAVPLFLLKDSYDYRLVLWLPCVALPFAWLRAGSVDAAWRAFAIVLIALFMFVSGIELPCTWLDAIARGSGAQWPTALATGLSYAKQFAAWTLAGLLALQFATIAVARIERESMTRFAAVSSDRIR